MGRVKRKIGNAVAAILFLAGSFALGNEAGKFATERERSAVEVVQQAPGEAQPDQAVPEVGQPESGRDKFSGLTQLPVEKPPAQTQAEEPLQEQDTGRVVFIYDGDTINVKLDNRLVKVRLLGIDTPELVPGEFGVKAAAYTRKLLQGQNVNLTYDRRRLDKYGRTLAYVYLPDGTFVNARLVEQGFARVMTIPPNTAHAGEFERLQYEARKERRGIWADPPPMCTWRGEKTIKSEISRNPGGGRGFLILKIR